MRFLVSGSTKSLARMLPRFQRSLGFLMTPKNGNAVSKISNLGIPWAIDNGAYSGFNATAFTNLLNRAYNDAVAAPAWVVCPDVVADAAGTLAMFNDWQPRIKECRFAVAFVSQDGQDALPIPWDRFSCLFIGGSTKWKLSQACADIAWEAQQRGKLLHMGRVNSFKRMTTALLLGCQSVDGSSAARWGDKHIGRFAKWLNTNRQQPALNY